MIEGLWVVRFQEPNDPEMELNGGVAVIETGRILGGDSGYYYVGEIGAPQQGRWPANLTVSRHDPTIVSVFGDVDNFTLSGVLEAVGPDASGREIVTAAMRNEPTGIAMIAQMTKVSELP